jgi:hypothetical protein
MQSSLILWTALALSGGPLLSADDAPALPPDDGPWPRLILYCPVYDPATLLQDPPRLAEQLPFDGMVWAGMDNHHRGSGEGWLGVSVFNSPYELQVEDFSEFIGNMRRLRDLRPDMTEQFLHISPTWTWTTDAETADKEGLRFWFGEKGEGREWQRVRANLRVACEVARQAGLRGFVLDCETYILPRWRYDRQRDAQELGKGREETWQQIRRCGEEFVQVLNDHFPDATLLLPASYGWADALTYELLPAFLDGLFAAAGPRLRLVDGWEQSYRYHERPQFLEAYWQIHGGLKSHSAVPEKYARQVSAGFGLWLEGRGGSPENPTANYPPELWESTLANALSVADHYVWVYSQSLLWWADPLLPPAYVEATRRARENGRRRSYGPGDPRPGPLGVPNVAQTFTRKHDPEVAHCFDFENLEVLLKRTEKRAELPLDGWRFQPDPQGQGEQAGYFRADFDDRSWPSIHVGEPWDVQGYADLDGSGWYRRPYHCPPLPEGKRVFLLFDAVDESAWLYVDGQLVAWHDEDPAAVWDQPFALEVTGHLTGGQEHLLALRVHDTTRAGGIWKPIYLLVEK